jgi:hypothetical protein
MNPPLPPADLRILAAVASLTGADSLANQEVDKFPPGALAFVSDQASFYYWNPTSTATVASPDIVAGPYGSSVAGRWVRYGGAASDVPATVSVAFGQLAASGVTSASAALTGLLANDSIVLNPQSALAQGIAYARCAVSGTLIVGLNNAATVTVAAQTIVFDVKVIR